MSKIQFKNTLVAFVYIALLCRCDAFLLWQGDEEVIVRMDNEFVTVPLKGLSVYEFKGKDAVRLSEIIDKSLLVDTPEDYFYNFIARDGYSLAALLVNENKGTGLPPWEDMQKGYLYQSQSYGLIVGWEEDTLGGQLGQCYNVKYMDGGVIEIREEDVSY